MIFTKSINRSEKDGKPDHIVRYITTGVGGDAIIGASSRSVILSGAFPHIETEREMTQLITQLRRAWKQHESLKSTGRYLQEGEILDLHLPIPDPSSELGIGI